MSNKTYHVKPSVDYRKASSDWASTVIAFIVIFGTMFVVFVAGILVGVPEQ